VVEPARLDHDLGALEEVARIAQLVRRQGDPGEQREAERLLEAVERAAHADAEPVAVVGGRHPEPDGEFEVAPVPTGLGPGPAGGEGWAPEPEAGAEPEEVRPRSPLARYAFPILLGLIILVNVIARLLGDD
jgi:hypothetical protein